MIAVLRPNAAPERVEMLISWLQKQGLKVHITEGEYQNVLGLIGDTRNVDMDMLSSLDIVESVTRVTDPFKAVGRKFHPEDSVISTESGVAFGGEHFSVIAGPACIESEAQMLALATAAKAGGAGMLYGGTYLPRTSPYDYQGPGEDGLEILSRVGKAVGLPIISEIRDIRSLPKFENVDIIQVGPRNAQNFDLLRELGSFGKPVLLKRGNAGTIKELLMSAEYIVSNGNSRIILCERGIRTFDSTYTRETLDISAIPVLRELTHLPVVVDPCYAAGRSALIGPLALAATAAGADGLILELHNDPERALSGGAQSITTESFQKLMSKISGIREVL